MNVGVYIEADADGAAGRPEALTGCHVFGSSVVDVLARLPAAIADFVGWLRKHGEDSPIALAEGEVPQIAVLQQIATAEIPNQPGHRAALFDLDRGYLSDAELDRRLRWLDHSRADLLALLADHTVLELTDPTDRSELPWTVRQILRHLANAEYGYTLRVAGPWFDPDSAVNDEHPADIFERLTTIRTLVRHAIKAIPLSERDRVIYPTWHRRPNDPWTLKKALRRTLEHEREHTGQLSALLYRVAQTRGPKVGG